MTFKGGPYKVINFIGPEYTILLIYKTILNLLFI